MSKPEVYMLCGLTGSGKSTRATELVRQGFVKLSLDESMRERHGRVGVDFPGEKYRELEEEVDRDLKQELIGLLATGQSVVLDYGFWQQSNRDHFKELIEKHGGVWQLLYFKADKATLLERLEQRNERDDANAVHITPAMLDSFIARFEEPRGEGEQVIEAGSTLSS
jgi:predicted kinase